MQDEVPRGRCMIPSAGRYMEVQGGMCTDEAKGREVQEGTCREEAKGREVQEGTCWEEGHIKRSAVQLLYRRELTMGHSLRSILQ